ncbi:MAG: VCBS repeat-containing protein, partial [Thermoplasmata archaeon]|nr:VCBS repeat-containing protein [Thermoplasmata archaeon]
LEVDTPGDSYVEVSILDATEESSVVGFANATIPNFVKIKDTDVSVYTIAPANYPELRIQVNLVADGADRPSLLGSSLHYIGNEEWRDDFLGAAKIKEYRGINFTDGTLEVNLSKKGISSGPSVYDDFPSIIFSSSMSDFQVAYPNTARTDYQSLTEISVSGYGYGTDIDDLDLDGYLDIITAESSSTSEILWGDSTGIWSTSRSTTLNVAAGQDAITGDFNGDGWPDIAIAAYSASIEAHSMIFLNDGTGGFSSDPDITFTDIESRYLGAGDLDGDGYDDLVLAVVGNVYVYNGGPDGPDTTEDMTISRYSRDLLVEDLDGDGYLDLALSDRSGSKSTVYMGDENGIDSTVDHEL